MMKVRGLNLNRNTVKESAKNAQNNSGDEDVAGIMSLVPGVKSLRLRNAWS